MEDLSNKSVAELLKSYPHLELLPTNRIKCNVTNHEMPPTVRSIVEHLNGQKYKKALEWYSHDYSQYLPYIVPHKDDHRKLFCTLTHQPLNKIPKELEKHVNGKRFQRLKAEAEEKAESKLRKNNEKKKKDQEEEEEEEQGEDDPDCWVPDFPISDDEEEEPDKVRGKRKAKATEEEEEASEEEDHDDEEVTEQEEEDCIADGKQAPAPKLSKSTSNANINRKRKGQVEETDQKKKVRKANAVIQSEVIEDFDDEQFIIRKTEATRKKKAGSISKKQKLRK